MVSFKNVAKGALDFITSEGAIERLVFRRFKGDKLSIAIRENKKLSKRDIETVILKVNPQEISFTKRKVIQKVQTSAPGRFIVFDWGSELTVVSISGNTGQLLPESITSGTNPIADVLGNIADAIPPHAAQAAPRIQSLAGGASELLADGSAFIQQQLMHGLSYFEKLELSPKYKSFKNLEKMFDFADADSDIITLEIDNGAIYRGFFEEFSFTIDANNPWNWKYNVTYVILSNLADAVRRWDDQYGTSSNIKK